MTRDIHTTQDSASHEERADAPLPVVDLQGFRSGDGGSRQAVASTIGAAGESIGFIYVANHGVPQQTIDAALAATRSFFARPAEEKRAVARPPRTYRGYIPMMPFSEDRDSGERYLYEAFIVGPELEAGAAADMRWPNLWPDGVPELRVALMSYYRALTTLSDHLLEAFAMALGQRDDALRGYFERPMTNISLLHYPARPEGAGQDAANARPHFDTNALTILLPGAWPGGRPSRARLGGGPAALGVFRGQHRQHDGGLVGGALPFHHAPGAFPRRQGAFLHRLLRLTGLRHGGCPVAGAAFPGGGDGRDPAACR